MNLSLIVTPEQETAAMGSGCPLVHLAYGLRDLDSYTLTVRGLAPDLRSGYMGLRFRTDRASGLRADRKAFSGGPAGSGIREKSTSAAPSALAVKVLQECQARGFQGVLAMPEGPVCDGGLLILRALEDILIAHKLTLLVPEIYGSLLDRAQVLICSALSGGQLREHLTEGLEAYGSRAVLELRRLQTAFSIPCVTAEGEPVSQAELQSLLEAYPAYYSEALGCNYLAVSPEAQARLVLYDTPGTLGRKLALAEGLGYSRAVALYSEIRDLPGRFCT